MELNAKIEKLGKLKEKIDTLNAQYAELKDEIMKDMESLSKKKEESKNFSVTIKYANYTTYNNNIIEVLKKKAPVAITETYDTKILKELIANKVLKDSDISKYRTTSERKSFTLTTKK